MEDSCPTDVRLGAEDKDMAKRINASASEMFRNRRTSRSIYVCT